MNTPDQDALKKAAKEALEEIFIERDRGTYNIPIQEHYTDHKVYIEDIKNNYPEYKANHDFTTDFRKTTQDINKHIRKAKIGGVITVIAGIIVVIFRAFWKKYIG